MALTDKLVNIADAIRGKTGKTDAMTLDQMITEIEGISSGGGNPNENLIKYFTGGLDSFDLDEVTGLGIPAIDYVRLAGVTRIDHSQSIPWAKVLVMPNLTYIGMSAMQNLGNLIEFHAASLTEVFNNSLQNNGNVVRYDFGSLKITGNYTGCWCPKLEVVIIRTPTICNNSSPNVFKNSGITNGTGYIYVPRALLSDDDETKDYRRATNWSVFADRFRAIEDYPNICGEVLT